MKEKNILLRDLKDYCKSYIKIVHMLCLNKPAIKIHRLYRILLLGGGLKLIFLQAVSQILCPVLWVQFNAWQTDGTLIFQKTNTGKVPLQRYKKYAFDYAEMFHSYLN